MCMDEPNVSSVLAPVVQLDCLFEIAAEYEHPQTLLVVICIVGCTSGFSSS